MEREPGVTALPKNLQFRVGLLLGLTLMVAIGFVVYVLYARGVFEAGQRLTLGAENAEGGSIGMGPSVSRLPLRRVDPHAPDRGRAPPLDTHRPRQDPPSPRPSRVV